MNLRPYLCEIGDGIVGVEAAVPIYRPCIILKSEIYTVDHCWLEVMPGRIRKTEDVFKILKFATRNKSMAKDQA